MDMLDAYLSGTVPHAVMADWCEERGLVFPRAVVGANHRFYRRGVSRCRGGIRGRSMSYSRAGGRTRTASCSASGVRQPVFSNGKPWSFSNWDDRV